MQRSQLIISSHSSSLIESHVWEYLPLLTILPELCRVKACACIEKESRHSQTRSFKACEQILKSLGDVVKVVVEIRNRCGHGKRYALPVCDIDSIGGRSFLASLVSTPLPRSVVVVWLPSNLHWTCPRNTCNGSILCPKPFPIRRSTTTCGNGHTRFCSSTASP